MKIQQINNKQAFGILIVKDPLNVASPARIEELKRITPELEELSRGVTMTIEDMPDPLFSHKYDGLKIIVSALIKKPKTWFGKLIQSFRKPNLTQVYETVFNNPFVPTGSIYEKATQAKANFLKFSK